MNVDPPDHYLPEHLTALAPILPTIADSKRLHAQMVQDAGRQVQDPVRPEDHAFMRGAIHAYNLFDGGLELVLSGRFDVCLYLLRATRDAQSLITVTANDRHLAEKFLRGALKGGEARRRFEQLALEQGGSEFADMVAQSLRVDDAVYQASAHMGGSHLAHVDGIGTAGEPVPTLGFVSDPVRAIAFTKVLLNNEMRVLLFMYSARGSSFTAATLGELARLEALTLSWLESEPVQGAPLTPTYHS